MNSIHGSFFGFFKRYKIAIFFIASLIIAIFCITSLFSLQVKEWLYYNFYLNPLYTVFYFSSIQAYWVDLVSSILVSIIAICVAICLFLPSDSKKKENWTSRIIQIFSAILISALAFWLLGTAIKDTIEVYNNRYEIVNSDMTYLEKTVKRGGRGSSQNAYYIRYRVANCDDCLIDFLTLDAYQYKELKKICEEYETQNILPENIKLKLYHISTSDRLMKYEWSVSE